VAEAIDRQSAAGQHTGLAAAAAATAASCHADNMTPRTAALSLARSPAVLFLAHLTEHV